jgi:hypothetical protein
MNVDELLRSSLRAEADSVTPIDDLLQSAIARGRRKQRWRRAGVAAASAGTAAVIAAAAVAVSSLGTGRTQVLTAAPGGATSRNLSSAGTPARPWWKAWPTGRHDGKVDSAFTANVQSTEPKRVHDFATGTLPDGTDWELYTIGRGTVANWVQGWNGSPDYGEAARSAQPGMTWTSFSTPTLAAHRSTNPRFNQQWLIIVGKPGTTAIEYASDGKHWKSVPVVDGIGIVKIRHGFAPAGSLVRLSDANGVYATGAPDGAGAGQPGSSGTATPTATPGTTARPGNVSPAPSVLPTGH